MRKEPVSLFWQLSIRILLIMIVLSILLLSVSVISHNTISNEMMVENQSLSFAQAQDNISSLFSQMVYTISQIALNNDLVSNLRQPVTDQYDYYARLRTMSEYLSTFSSQSDAYGMRILLIGTNGMKYGASLELADPLCITMEELNHLEITKKMLANKRMLICKQLHPRIHRQSGERVTLLGLILHSEYIDKVYGYLYISIEENAFHKQYSSLTSEKQRILLLTPDGDVASDSQRDNVGSHEEELLAMVQTLPPNEPTKTEWKGHEVFVTAARHPFGDGWLVEITDYESVSVQNRRMMLTMLGLSALCLGIMLMFTLHTVHRMTKPINDLSQKMTDYSGETAHLSFTENQEVKKLADGYNRMTETIQKMMSELEQQNEKRRESELQVLQMQIQPHFIYNALTSIQQLADMGRNRNVMEFCESLSSLLRMTIGDTAELIPLRKELELTQHYMKLQQVRHGVSVRMEISVAPDVPLEAQVPKLILQPVVENALVHGFSGLTAAGSVRINVRRRTVNSNDRICIDVIDDGIGMDETVTRRLLTEENVPHDGNRFSHVGLKNVQERIRMIYGKEYGLNIYSERDVGTQVTFVFPVKQESEKQDE